MNIKTMEGLVGARTNMNLLDVPFRVYKEARQKGDTGTMERAMGYVDDYSGKAEEYAAKADDGMEEDAKEARERAKSERESAIRKRKEEREKSEKRLEGCGDRKKDAVGISGDDNAAEKENVKKKEPVIYTKSGEPGQSQSESGTNISVTV